MNNNKLMYEIDQFNSDRTKELWDLVKPSCFQPYQKRFIEMALESDRMIVISRFRSRGWTYSERLFKEYQKLIQQER
jgi:hypothetical protein